MSTRSPAQPVWLAEPVPAPAAVSDTVWQRRIRMARLRHRSRIAAGVALYAAVLPLALWTLLRLLAE